MRENPLFSEKFYDTFIFAILESAEEFLPVVRTIVIERKKGSGRSPLERVSVGIPLVSRFSMCFYFHVRDSRTTVSTCEVCGKRSTG